MTRIRVAQMASVLDGRSNSGTARVAYEIFSELSKHDSVTQTLIHFPAKKIILTMHDAGGYLLPGVNTFFTFINKVTVKLNLRKISKIIVVSENAKYLLSKAAKIPQDKIVVISNASCFSQLISRAPLSINQKFIVCVSRWQRHKNVGNLVEGFAHFKTATESDIKLVLVGKPVGGFDEPLIKINKLKLDDDIINLTDLEDVEIAWLFDNAVLNIFPSLLKTQII